MNKCSHEHKTWDIHHIYWRCDDCGVMGVGDRIDRPEQR